MRRAIPTLACLLVAGVAVIDNPHCGGPQRDHTQMALDLVEQGRYEQAVVAARRALRQHGSRPDLHLVEAMALAGAGRPEESLEAVRSGLERDPDNPRLHAALRDICRQFGLHAAAQPLLSRLVEQRPDSPAVKATLGWIWVQLGEDERGEDLLQRAAAQGGPTFAHLELARILQRQERLAEAAEVLAQALALEPQHPGLLLALGQTRLSQGLPEEARHAFDRSVAASEEPGRAASRVAQACYEQGHRRLAIEFYERALDHSPRDAAVQNNLAWTYAEEGVELDRAVSMALHAVKQAPDNVVYLDTYAEVLYRRGQPARAMALMRRALALEPLDGEHYAYLRSQMGRFSGAGTGARAVE
ncbi:MAG: tetratricopeptide repeat protein [Candidatus Latescibacterota bacterium]